MILDRLHLPLLQLLRHLIHPLPRRTINDPRLPLGDHLPQPRILLTMILRLNDVQTQIGTLKSSHRQKRIPQVQHLHDVPPHLRRRRRRQGHHLRPPQLLQRHPQSNVVRPEVMPPLRQTMCLIHRKQRNFHLLQRPQKGHTPKPFRRDIHQLKLATLQPVNPRHLLPSAQRAVNQRRRNPPPLQRIHLILHQRDQRTHHHRHPLHHHRRQLITQTLPSPGRHDHQRIPSG